MKKIIDGRMYNTETAQKLGEYWNGLGKQDFDYIYQILYRKRNGEYFLYSDQSEQIRPLSYDRASEWAEEKLSTEDYEEVFGETSEGEESLSDIHVQISSDLYKKMQQYCQKNSKNNKQVITEALEKLLG